MAKLLESDQGPQSGASPASFPKDDPRWQLVERIVRSRTFSRAAHLRNFLLFVVQESLSGDSELTEYRIGVHALARPANYSPNEDNIVRVQARLLRQRLEIYFATEGALETLRVDIPKGAYAPHFFEISPSFEPATAAPEPPDKEQEPAPEPAKTPATPRQRLRLLVFAIAVVTVAIVWAGYRIVSHRSAAAIFWRQIFPPGGSVLLIPTDTSLVALQDLTHSSVRLNGYIATDYWRNLAAPDDSFRRAFDEIAARQQTSMASIEAVLSLMKRPEAAAANVTARAPRDLRVQDVDRVNAILIGARHSNPWVELFSAQCNFNTDYTGVLPTLVTNRSPKPGERNEYTFTPSDPKAKVYGLIAFLPNRTPGKSVLLIRGTGIAGTRSAIRFLEQSEMFEAFLRKIEKRGAIPHFDLLLESNGVAGGAPPAAVLAYRVLD